MDLSIAPDEDDPPSVARALRLCPQRRRRPAELRPKRSGELLVEGSQHIGRADVCVPQVVLPQGDDAAEERRLDRADDESVAGGVDEEADILVLRRRQLAKSTTPPDPD